MRITFSVVLGMGLALGLPMGWSLVAVGSDPAEARRPAIEIEHEVRDVEGWQVHVDRRLLAGEHQDTGRLGLRVLEMQLFDITLVVPADRLAKLREIPIFLDLDHPLNNLQYHPSVGWLKNNGYDPAMQQAVHIPNVERLINIRRSGRMPWVVLHELAHGYHDRMLGFDHAEIREVFEKARDSGKYDKVLNIDGRRVRHYAMTDHKEYFAELSESYFGMNDFYPFVRSELKEFDPAGYALMETIWRAPAE